VFSRTDGLYAAPFDLGRRVVTGEVVPLMSGLRSPTAGPAYFVVGGGTLFYAPGGVMGTGRRLIVAGAAGDTVAYVTERGSFGETVDVTTDGRRAAVVVFNAKGTYEIWIAGRDQHGLRLGVALANADCSFPIWSPDGVRLAFWRLARDAQDGVYVVRAGSGQAPRKIMGHESADTIVQPMGWVPDGSGLIVRRFDKDGVGDLLLVPLRGDSAGAPRPFRATPANEVSARYSPDGRHVAFVSDESGKFQAYVATVAADGTLDLPVLVSAGSGAVGWQIHWAGDGRRVIYETDDERLMVVAIDTRGEVAAQPPVEIASLTDLRVNRGEWTVLPDGRLLVIRKGEDEDEVRRFDLVMNWTTELGQRMAAARGR
jgi:Tol biopolymer transport system component